MLAVLAAFVSAYVLWAGSRHEHLRGSESSWDVQLPIRLAELSRLVFLALRRAGVPVIVFPLLIDGQLALGGAVE